MVEKIKYFAWFIAYKLVSRLVQLVTFIIDIMIHPLINISIWMATAVYFCINKVDIYKLSGKEMFLFSAGLVTILTFIVTFLQSVTVDSSKKENFYLGYNLKRNLYDNFWIKRFNEMHIKLFLWSLIIIPVLKIASNYHYEYGMLNSVIDNLKVIGSSLYSIWLSIMIMICIYCAAILIESIYQAKNIFRMSNIYQSENWIAKIRIEMEIKKYFTREFDKVLKVSFGYLFNSYNGEAASSSELTDFIFNRAYEVKNTEAEFKKYLELVFVKEITVMENNFEKIDKFVNSNSTNKKYWNYIKSFVLSRYLEKIRWYYTGKWNSIEQSNFFEYSPSAIVQIANWDLIRLYNLEKKFVNQSKDLNKIYKNTFWGAYATSKIHTIYNNKEVKNLCISKIVDNLKGIFNNTKNYEHLEYRTDIYTILDTLNNIDGLIKNQNYVSEVFEALFDCVLETEGQNSACLEEINKELYSKHCNQFILNEAEKYSYSILMSGHGFSAPQLKLLLNSIKYKNIIVVLIFHLAYVERSQSKNMTSDEFKIWKDRIYQVPFGENLSELNKNKFIDELSDEIAQSNVSHFIFSEFLEWLWKSLFVDFDSSKYQEFKELGIKGIRRDFGLCSYMILRSILLSDKYKVYNSFRFSEIDREDIQKELSQIKDVLDFY
ncbi:hypothetical protein [Sporolactobacillus pectinivorans]|uniref:hypothetical protein n=1 Tax=Sporolactobacillus pectinivorans TaxID=1591408 RepID=UPI000C25B9C4|nr:hypothetical protein [Sporolactobacillus pectinivorans]